MSRSCTISEILSVIYQNLNRSRDSEHIPYGALEFLCISQHTKLELSGFTNSKDIIGGQNLKNGSRDADHAHYGVVCHPKASLRTGIRKLESMGYRMALFA